MLFAWWNHTALSGFFALTHHGTTLLKNKAGFRSDGLEEHIVLVWRTF